MHHSRITDRPPLPYILAKPHKNTLFPPRGATRPPNRLEGQKFLDKILE